MGYFYSDSYFSAKGWVKIPLSRTSLTSLKLNVGAWMNMSTQGSRWQTFKKMKYTCLQYENWRFPRNFVIVFLNAGQLQPGRELIVIWYCFTSGGVPESRAMMQPWPGWGIIVTTWSRALRDSEEPKASLCCGFGRPAVRLTIFPSLFPGYLSASAGTGTVSRFAGGFATCCGQSLQDCKTASPRVRPLRTSKKSCEEKLAKIGGRVRLATCRL